MCDLQKKYSKVVEMPRIRKIYSFAVPDCQRAIQESEKTNRYCRIEKISTKTKKVQHMMTYREIYQKFVKSRKQYIAHKY